MPSVEVEIYVWRQLSYVFFVRSFDCALFYFCEVNVGALKERRVVFAVINFKRGASYEE